MNAAEILARARKAAALATALRDLAARIGRANDASIVRALARELTDAQWKQLAVVADVNVPSELVRELVIAELQGIGLEVLARQIDESIMAGRPRATSTPAKLGRPVAVLH